MTDVHDQSNFPRPGRHRSPDDWDDDYRDDDYRDAPAADATYAAYAADHREYDDYDDDFRDDERPTDTGGGMPLRGLAMICIFIGVCLVGWGLYTWSTGNDGAGNDGSGDDAGTVAEAPAGQRPDMNPDAGADGRPDAEAPGPGADEDADADADGEHPEINRGEFHITVLNNSEEPGLAARVSDDLTREGWGRGETGNAAEGEAGVWERTTVHYTPDNDAEKAAAEDIAHANGWDIAPRDDRLANAPGGIVVVTAIDANR